MAEWKERVAMKAEDQGMRRTKLAANALKTREQMEEDARAIREHELNVKWQQKMVEAEVEKQQLIEQLTEAAMLRGTKKKKKGKGKGKK